MNKRKNLGNKSQELTYQKFSGRLFVSESMSNEKQQLSNKCWQLKNVQKIHSTRFFNNVVNLNGIDGNFKEYIDNVSF